MYRRTVFHYRTDELRNKRKSEDKLTLIGELFEAGCENRCRERERKGEK